MAHKLGGSRGVPPRTPDWVRVVSHIHNNPDRTGSESRLHNVAGALRISESMVRRHLGRARREGVVEATLVGPAGFKVNTGLWRGKQRRDWESTSQKMKRTNWGKLVVGMLKRQRGHSREWSMEDLRETAGRVGINPRQIETVIRKLRRDDIILKEGENFRLSGYWQGWYRERFL